MVWSRQAWLLFVCLLSLCQVRAIFEEQAGVIDWHKANLGQLTHAEFAFRGRERLFVGSRAGVVASLQTQDGSIVWRQTLGKESAINDLTLIPRPASIVTLSSENTVVRAWQAVDGALLWQKSASEAPTKHGGLLVLPDSDSDPSSKVAVCSGGRIEAVVASSGKRIWMKESLGGQIMAVERDVREASLAILVALKAERSSTILRLDPKTGEQLSSVEIPHALESIALSSTHAAGLTDKGQVLGQDLGGQSLQLRGLTDTENHPAQSLGGFVTPHLLSLHSDQDLFLIDVTTPDLRSQAFPGIQLARRVKEGSTEVVMAGITKQGGLVVTVWDSSSKQSSDNYAIDTQLLTNSGQPLQVRSISVGSKPASLSPKFKHRIFVEVSDDSVWLLEEGEVKWRSEEGLASIQDVSFVDLPPSTREAISSWESARPSLVDRMNAEVLTVKKALGYSQPGDDEQLKDITARMSTNLLPYRDTNGFRKLLVALSASGKLFGLHSGRGSIVWTKILDDGIPLSKLLLWQIPLDPTLAPKLLALGSQGKRTRLVVFDAYTGHVSSEDILDGLLIKILHLPHYHAEKVEQQAFGLVFEDFSVQLWPRPDGSGLPKAHLPLHFWVAQGGTLTGFRLDSWEHPAVPTWESIHSAPQRTLLKIIAPDPSEAVYSYAKVLGNRDMKLKYLNSNLVFVISSSVVQAEEPSLHVQLIDTVSGQMLYSQSLQKARGPVAGIWSENWVVYSYYSIANQRYEVSVLEFYEAQARPLSIPSLLFGQQNSSYSSFAPPLLQVLHQSYWSQVGITRMTATSTRKGITSKQLLVATDTDQVYLLDKRFVDPRRPRVAPTKVEEGEILPVYSEELVFAPHLFATHKERVEGLHGIATVPANLESTTLSVFYGLDLFFTRIQPSKTFDLLPDDFPYAMLILVFLTLFIGSVALRRLDEKKAVKRKWN